MAKEEEKEEENLQSQQNFGNIGVLCRARYFLGRNLFAANVSLDAL